MFKLEDISANDYVGLNIVNEHFVNLKVSTFVRQSNDQEKHPITEPEEGIGNDISENYVTSECHNKMV